MLTKSHSQQEMLYKNQSNTSDCKTEKCRVMVLVHCTSSHCKNYAYQVWSHLELWWQNYVPDKKCFLKINQRGTIQNKAELQFLCTALRVIARNMQTKLWVSWTFDDKVTLQTRNPILNLLKDIVKEGQRCGGRSPMLSINMLCSGELKSDLKTYLASFKSSYGGARAISHYIGKQIGQIEFY